MKKHLPAQLLLFPGGITDADPAMRIRINGGFHPEGRVREQIKGSTGYGETLIDHNHRQTTLGVSASFVDG